MEKISEVQIQTVAPQEGLSVGVDCVSGERGRSTPMRGELTEKGEEEHQKHNRNADRLSLGGHAIDDDGWSLRLDGGGDDHAKTHANCADDEKRLTAEAVDGPGGVEREDDAEGGVEGVDEGNLRGTGEDLLVDLGGIGVERALTGNLLAGVDDESEQQTLAHRGILP